MASATNRTCVECGARLDAATPQCGLCGWPVGKNVDLSDVVDSASESSPRAQAASVFCNGCGWKNPPQSHFCSQCGSRLQVIEGVRRIPTTRLAALDSPVKKAQREVNRQISLIVGAGLVLVVALFLVTAVSRKVSGGDAVTTASSEAVDVPAEPISSDLASIVAALDSEIALLTGPDLVAKRQEKIAILYREGRIDLAAGEQRRVADVTQSTEDWKRAGDLYYDWMTGLEEQQLKIQAAVQAVECYEQVLAADPDNLDVRTDMATALLNTGNPMMGVSEVKRVLETDPNHLNANFNYGLMLTWINRHDQAIEQFERVMELTDESSDHYRRAGEAIAAIRAGGGS